MSTKPRILHCLRAPLGGVLRHVTDLAGAQAERGLDVGIICDSTEDNEHTNSVLEKLGSRCSLGIHRFAMKRMPGYGDIQAALAIRAIAKRQGANVLHGHGAKGGAYARLAAVNKTMAVFYTPHGGSLHFSPGSIQGKIYFAAERLFERWTSAIIFESRYGMDTYKSKIRTPHCAARVIHNGLREEEFKPARPNSDAADFLYLGELRKLKGVDVLLHALARLQDKKPANAVIVGYGPDEQDFRRLAGDLGLAERVTFYPPMPIREAFILGRVMVMPSRAESFPYVVLETAAAAMPLIATNVGGIPEIFGDMRDRLTEPGDADALALAMESAREYPEETAANAKILAAALKGKFTLDLMAKQIIALYEEFLPANITAKTNYEAFCDNLARQKQDHKS